MMNKKIVSFVAFLCLIEISHGDQVPVLYWCSNSFLNPALKELSTEDFSEIIKPKLDDSMVVVFQEDKLTSEDLSLCKIEGKTCFTHLSSYSSRSYFLSVDKPIEAIARATQKREYFDFNADGELQSEIKFEIGKVVFVNLYTNDILLRSETLHAHDNAIDSVFSKVSKQGKVIGIYTGDKSHGVVRKIRQVSAEEKSAAQKQNPTPTPEPKKPVGFNIDNKVLIYYDAIYHIVSDKNDTLQFEHAEIVGEEKANKIEIALTDALKTNKLNIIFAENSGYWNISELHFNNNKYRIEFNFSIPLDLSYACSIQSNYTLQTDKNDKILFMGIQVQPRFSKSKNDTKDFKFSDAWHCVGFTSAGIWSGLFVTFMFLAILSIGITWMMDINTMDRFDDPKGKTITITASD